MWPKTEEISLLSKFNKLNVINKKLLPARNFYIILYIKSIMTILGRYNYPHQVKQIVVIPVHLIYFEAFQRFMQSSRLRLN